MKKRSAKCRIQLGEIKVETKCTMPSPEDDTFADCVYRSTRAAISAADDGNQRYSNPAVWMTEFISDMSYHLCWEFGISAIEDLLLKIECVKCCKENELAMERRKERALESSDPS